MSRSTRTYCPRFSRREARIGGLVLIALIATWRFSVTKTGPFAEGMNFMMWLTCKKPHNVVVGTK